MKNKTKEVEMPGFVKTIAMVLLMIAGIAFIASFLVIATSFYIYLAAVAFFLFLIYLPISLISWMPGKVMGVIFIIAVAYLIFR